MSVYLIISFTRDNIVNEIVVTDTWAPLIERVAFLETNIIDGERD
jgi:hypothetical protein